ncbi:kinesin-like protein KIF24 isoform X2 [Taeniopygia guttata]|uniref:kinesin-like protein KIF24 isoform X2 n=1 Tax=Taeniopygia guttata TaxID=59729 RepID=UPI003BB94309
MAGSRLKMASCLYECLCEAELEKYFPHFAAFGLQKIDELAKVSMEDYTKLGVHDVNDLKRLFQLIRIIKIRQREDAADLSKQDFQPHGLFIQPQVTKSGPYRQLRFESFCEENDGTVKESESELYHSPDFSANEKKDSVGEMLGHIPPHNSVGEMLGHIPPHDSEPIRLTRRDLNIPGIGTKDDLSCPTVSDDIAHLCISSNTFDKETPWTESEKIRVCVRKRPLCQREERLGESNIITVEDKETLILHQKKEAVDLTQYILQHVFYFDEVFEETCTNEDVYMKTAYPLIQHIFNGGNATCFAYGQTGAGKTYTMIGTHQNPGLYALAAQDIFRHLEASPSRKDLIVLISFYEIYCRQLYDLLNGRKRLFAREDGKRIVQIAGLQEVRVDSVDQLLEVILKGGKERSTGTTAVNSDSSRSHAIIQIQIKDMANRAFGRISFIDLAGSERAADAKDTDRQTKMEGVEINQSLLALKECIRALDQEHTHTPFRQSTLTQVLKDSFIGNSKTCMIANVSPSHVATEHTLNTLRYADRVKELKKGIKYPTPVTKRHRRAGNVFPKRVQTTPSLPSGEKSSPKKVKLGLQHPSSATKGRAYPALLQPPGVPLTSTPKGTDKGHAYKGTRTPCFHHTTPVKGVLRITHPLKKNDLSPHSEKSLTVKDFIATAETEESGQQDKYMQNRTPVQYLKVQTAQPLQKQLVPREDNSFGVGNLPSDSEQEWGNTFTKQSVGPWAYLPPYQKEREKHLRLYHQQLQQPPILKQKLNYQPLERFLMQYKPEEIQVKPEPSLTLTEVQSKEWVQLEDVDDSDFSEDSFSPVCSQKSVKRGNSNKSSPHSFFLHERERGSEEEQKYKSKHRRLVYSSEATLTPEKNASTPCVSPVLKSGTPECKEFDLQHEEKEESTLDKEAALAEGGVKWKARKSGVSHSVSSIDSSEFTSELMAPLLVLPLDGEDTTETEKAPSNQEKPHHKKQVLDSDAHSRFEDEGWQCTRSRSLTDSMLDPWDQSQHGERLCVLLGSSQVTHKKRPSTCGRVKPCCSHPGSVLSKQGVRHSSFVGHDLTETSTAGSTAGSAIPRPEKEGGGLCSDSPFKEHSESRQCSADINQHNNAGNAGKSNSSKGSSAEEINAEIPEKSYASQSLSQDSSWLLQPKPELSNEDLTHTEDPSKSSFGNEETALLKRKLKQSIFTLETFAADAGFTTKDNKPIASAKCPSHMSRSSSPSAASKMGKGKWQREALEKAQETVIRAHQQYLDEMAELCLKEECLIDQMSEMDFQDFMTILDEILVLKFESSQKMRALLQFCSASLGTETSLRTRPLV